MVRDKPLHNFLFEMEESGFFRDLDGWCTPWIDLCVLLQLTRKYKPKRFLEVGTHKGHTTRVVAEKFPDMEIVTIDPGDAIPQELRPHNQMSEYLPQEEIGLLVKDHKNVKIIKQPFEEVRFETKFDMIFLDGNHSLPHVLRDSYQALSLLNEPGVVLWHDYNNVADVNTALAQLNLDHDITSLHNTWMAYYDTH